MTELTCKRYDIVRVDSAATEAHGLVPRGLYVVTSATSLQGIRQGLVGIDVGADSSLYIARAATTVYSRAGERVYASNITPRRQYTAGLKRLAVREYSKLPSTPSGNKQGVVKLCKAINVPVSTMYSWTLRKNTGWDAEAAVGFSTTPHKMVGIPTVK